MTFTELQDVMNSMEGVLSEFIAHTGADPGLAQDILEGQQWNLSKSLQAYYFLRGITASTLPAKANGHSSQMNNVFHPAVPLAATAGTEQQQQQQAQKDHCGSGSSTAPNSPSKPPLQKGDAVDLDDANKKLARGISRATENINLVSKARNEFAMDFRDSSSTDFIHDYIVETPVYTFTLPDFTIYPKDFVAFLEKDLIETSTLVSLEQAGRLNWWTESGACQRLWPLATTGDGNCLLHAASLGMWGFHDRLLTLRKALHATLTKGPYRSALWRRWRWQQTLQNKEAGLVYSEEEWHKEWNNLLRLSSTEPRSMPGRRGSCCDSPATKGHVMRGIGILEPVMEHDDGGYNIYESLEEIHVLALAHVLRRPIIIVADTMLKDVTGEPFAPIPFGGVYLPLECRPTQCHRSPLVLTYDAAHFSALVAMEREAYVDKTPQPAAVIPLTDSEHGLLPLQFAVDPGENFNWGMDEDNPKVVYQLALTEDDILTLLMQYLDVEHVPIVSERPSIELPGQPMMSNGVASDVDKKSSGGSFESDDSSPSSTEAGPGLLAASAPKSKASKQLQSVAKQFGSIGRTMSKKFKKNFGNFKLGRSNSYKESSSLAAAAAKFTKDAGQSDQQRQALVPQAQRHTLPSSGKGPHRISTSQNFILAAKLNAERRHEYQEEMLKNYLHSARVRFGKMQAKEGSTTAAKMEDPLALSPPPVVYCVNPGCSLFGSVASSYLCSACFDKQKEQEQHELQQKPAHIGNYGIGRSRFYAEAESVSAEEPSKTGGDGGCNSLPNLTVIRKPTLNPDQTLYLSHSTFYNDINTPPTSSFGPQKRATVEDEKLFMRASSPHTFSTASAATAHAKLGSQPGDGPKITCRTPKCPFYGTLELDFYCSQCHKEQKMKKANTYPRLVDQMQTTHI